MQSLNRDDLPIAGVQLDGFGDFGVQGPQADIEPRLLENVFQASDIAHVKLIAGVVLGNQQHSAAVSAVPADRPCHGGDGPGQGFCREVVETAGEEIRVHRRNLVAGISHIH